MKVQIVLDHGQSDQYLTQLNWIKEKLLEHQRFYQITESVKLEILFDNSEIVSDADIYIKPYTHNSIKVEFAELSLIKHQLAVHDERSQNHWIIIDTENGLNAMSSFLLLLMGTVVLSSFMGTHICDLDDVRAVLQHGNHATILTIDALHKIDASSALSMLIWENLEEAKITNYEAICNSVHQHFRPKDLLTIINITNNKLLTNMGLGLVVKTNPSNKIVESIKAISMSY